MRLIIHILLFLFISTSIIAKEKGQTEITTEDGIEVFQNEKYYLLKKNVKIHSDNFILRADIVKINFNKNLYDITKIDAKGTVNFDSSKNKMNGIGEKLVFDVQNEILNIDGYNSRLITTDMQMHSDGIINVNNSNGKFFLKGPNSKLISENIFIRANTIKGIFTNVDGKNEVTKLNVEDKKISYVKNRETEMYAKTINFDNSISIIELIDDVTIIRNEEKITGDYGTLDTKNNSYKIKSNNSSKVKVIIQNNE